ncbi:MAG: class I SAM-dependent methyltransferase [Proteobacteria bacterium]|nr:class I SAM-dependent methyltransferase [Pseudomonadota bacterium]
MSFETDSWTEYWQAGQKTTFGSVDDFRENTHLKTLWERLLEAEVEGKFLEIGCGNAALSLLLIQLAEERSVNIDLHAIDAAKIKKNEEDLDNLTLHSETPVETMPFADEFFDGAVSHFGFEYADITASLASAQRVLKPGAMLTLVSHHRSSWLSRESFDVLRQLISIEQSGLMNTLERLLKRLRTLHEKAIKPAQDPEAENLREALNSTGETLQKTARANAFDPTFTLQVISSALRVFKEEHRAGKSHLEYLSLLQGALSSHAQRLQAHKRAALSDEGWLDVKRKMSDAGFSIKRFEPVVLNGYHYGQLVQAYRR